MNKPQMFEFGPFRLYPDERVLLSHGKNVSMPGRAKDVFLVLFEKRGQPVSKEELLKAVWGRDGGTDNNLYRAITDCKAALRKHDAQREYIENLREYGYRFVADDVREVLGEQGSSTPTKVSEAPSVTLALVKRHTLYLHTAAILYGLLAGLMIVVEVAYKLEEYPWAFFVAFLTSLWIYLTSVAFLRAMQSQVPLRPRAALVLGVLGFVVAALILFLAVAQYLPASSITQQTIQSSTAQAAYLKSTLYHLTLALPFLVLPFHFITAVQTEMREGNPTPRPIGAVYISPTALLAITLVYLVYALTAHHSLTGTLELSDYLNLFIILLWIRLRLLFGLAILSLIWYSQTLTELRRR